MLRAFHKDNRIVPLGIMLITFLVFVYHFELDRQGPLGEIPAKALPNAIVVESSRTASKRPVEEIYESQKDIKKEYQEYHYAVPSAIPSANPIVSSSSSSSPKSHNAKGLSTDDVVLMFKTGATVLWKRVPIHLTTSLSANRISHDNVLIYSDYPETIGDWQIIDVLANTSDKIRKSETFEPYLQQEDYESRQNYAELSNVPGDSAGASGGWKLDKFKFLPIVDHAGRNKPDAKWNIFMEDDSYLFLPNIIRHLQKFDHQEPWYLGSVAWIHGDFFAHGGSGFALSRGAWEQSFGQDPQLVQKFEAFTEAHGCGDHILGHALKEYGVQFGETRGENRFKYGFNPESHWSTWYEQANWCEPVYSWHHTHGRDVARFYSLEKSWDFDEVSCLPSIANSRIRD